VWDPSRPLGGIGREGIERASAIVWNGFCHVHTIFAAEDVLRARRENPGCLVAVHPECDPSVVDAADASGSTAYLKEYAERAPEGAAVVIGTEINFVARLSRQLAPGKKVLPLSRSLCPNMFRISPARLLWTLERLPVENEISVPVEIAEDAARALRGMLGL